MSYAYWHSLVIDKPHAGGADANLKPMIGNLLQMEHLTSCVTVSDAVSRCMTGSQTSDCGSIFIQSMNFPRSIERPPCTWHTHNIHIPYRCAHVIIMLSRTYASFSKKIYVRSPYRYAKVLVVACLSLSIDSQIYRPTSRDEVLYRPAYIGLLHGRSTWSLYDVTSSRTITSQKIHSPYRGGAGPL